MTITSAARIKAFLGIPAGLTFQDTAIGYAANAANGVVLRCLHQSTLALATVQEYPEVYQPGQVAVQLKHVPVVGLVAVTNDDCLLAATDYRLDTDTGDLRLTDDYGGYWSEEREGVEVMYGYGYTSATIPDELTHAADCLGASYWNRVRYAGLDSSNLGGYNVALSAAPMPPEVAAILAKYEDHHR